MPGSSEFRFSGHQTFPLRISWLPKAIRELVASRDPLNNIDEGITSLGLGKNMVEALRCWIEAFQIAAKNDHGWTLTPIGELVFHPSTGLDPYLEDHATNWLLHWLITTNTKSPFFAWECLFNRWPGAEFSATPVLEAFRRESDTCPKPASAVTLKQHWEVFLHSYRPPRGGKGEDHLDSAMRILAMGAMKRIATAHSIGRNGLRIKTEMFFDREAVVEAVGRAGAKALSKAGAFIQRRAKSSIRKRKRASCPGEPPSSHVATLRNRIYFNYDPPTRSVVVGPTPLGGVGVVPPVLEYGGSVPRRRNPRRHRRALGGDGEIRTDGPSSRTTKKNRDGKLVTYAKLQTPAQVDRANRLNEELYGPEFINEGRIAARPYMGPALQQEMPNLPALWAGSVK